MLCSRVTAGTNNWWLYVHHDLGNSTGIILNNNAYEIKGFCELRKYLVVIHG